MGSTTKTDNVIYRQSEIDSYAYPSNNKKGKILNNNSKFLFILIRIITHTNDNYIEIMG